MAKKKTKLAFLFVFLFLFLFTSIFAFCLDVCFTTQTYAPIQEVSETLTPINFTYGDPCNSCFRPCELNNSEILLYNNNTGDLLNSSFYTSVVECGVMFVNYVDSLSPNSVYNYSIYLINATYNYYNFSVKTSSEIFLITYNMSNNSVQYLDSIYLITNVSTFTNYFIDNVTYEIICPNTTIKTFYNITGVDYYNSSNQALDCGYGTYIFNFTTFDNTSNLDNAYFTYLLSDGNQSSNPSSWTLSQQIESLSTEDFNITHTADSWVEYNASIEGIDFNNASLFSYDLILDSFNISKNGSQIIQLNLTSTINTTNTTYNGNLTITKTYDNSKYKIPISIFISTSGVGKIDLIDYPANYKSITLTDGQTSEWSLRINNNGNRTLTDCVVSLTGTASAFTTLTDYTGFSVAVGETHTTSIQHRPSSVGSYSATIDVTCTATAEGGNDTEILSEDISVIASTEGGGGGGSASEPKSYCNLGLPDKITITERNLVRRLVIENPQVFSISPSWQILRVEGKPDGSNFIRVIGDIGTISGGSEDELSVLITDETIFQRFNETYYAQIEIGSSQCLEQVVQVEIKTDGTFFLMPESFTEFINNFVDFQSSELFEVGDYSVEVWVLTLIMSLTTFGIFIAIFYNKKFAFPKIIFSSITIIIIMEGILWAIL